MNVIFQVFQDAWKRCIILGWIYTFYFLINRSKSLSAVNYKADGIDIQSSCINELYCEASINKIFYTFIFKQSEVKATKKLCKAVIYKMI